MIQESPLPGESSSLVSFNPLLQITGTDDGDEPGFPLHNFVSYFDHPIPNKLLNLKDVNEQITLLQREIDDQIVEKLKLIREIDALSTTTQVS
jgi:hypothetical protein